MKSFLSRPVLLLVIGFVLGGGSFFLAANNFSIDGVSLLSAAFGAFSRAPSVTISRSINSPTGTIVPGRSQVLAVFDAKVQNVGSYAVLRNLPIQIAVGDVPQDVELSNFFAEYRFCVPKGNIFNYGYRYGYGGLYCRSISENLTPLGQQSSLYKLAFNQDLPLYAGQVSSLITISATARYVNSVRRGALARIRAGITDGATVQAESCQSHRYGYGFRFGRYGYLYGYVRCNPVIVPVRLRSNIGNTLFLSRPYGYGYVAPKPPQLNFASEKPRLQAEGFMLMPDELHGAQLDAKNIYDAYLFVKTEYGSDKSDAIIEVFTAGGGKLVASKKLANFFPGGCSPGKNCFSARKSLDGNVQQIFVAGGDPIVAGGKRYTILQLSGTELVEVMAEK